MKLYADRDVMKLDEDGDYYFKHVDAMTGESLRSKSDIAAELGFRDREIDNLKTAIDEARRYLNAINELATTNSLIYGDWAKEALTALDKNYPAD